MKMKRMLILMLTTFTVSLLLATPPFMWQENGIPLRQGVNIEWSRASAVLNNGTVVYVWSDTRDGGRDLFAQAVDETGVLWGLGGMVVDAKEDRQEDPVVIATSDGNAIVAWVDFVLDPINGDIFAQKISADGEIMWMDGCVALCIAPGIQISLNIVPDNDGGAYIIWQDQRAGTTDIYGVHVDAAGGSYPGWPADGLALAAGPGNQHYHTFWEDGQGGAILAYVNDLDGVETIHAKRILSNGEIDWTVVLADGPQEQHSVRMSPFGNSAFGFAYVDKVNGFFNIYVNAVDIDGEFLWNEAIAMNPAFYDQINPRVAAATDGNFLIVYEDQQMGTSNLFVQKMDINGNFLWGQGGLNIVDNPYDQKNPRIEADATGGCYVIWDDAREGGHPEIDIYMQHVTSAGTISWEVNGKAVAQVPGETFAPLIKPTDDYLFASWGDKRNGSVGIYYQAYDLNGVQLLADDGVSVYWGLSGDAIEHKAIRNGESVFVVWEDSRYANFGNQLKVQKIDAAGNTLFDTNGISVVEEHSGNHQSNASVIPHHSGGLALTWTEQPDAFVLIYAQAIDANGNPLWDPMGVRTSTLDYWYAQANPKISYDGDGGYIVGWDETNQLEDWNRDIRAQRIVDGQRVWDDEGIVVAFQTAGPQVDHWLEAVVGRYFIWFRVDGEDLYIKLLNEDGSVADGWDDYGNLICSAPNNRRLTKSNITPEGLLIVWEDVRSGTASIYGQLIDEAGETQWEENGLALINYANDQTIISLQYENDYFYLTWRDARVDPGAQDVAMQKFDMNGAPQWGDPAPFVISDANEQDNPNMAKIGDNLLIAWENNYGEVGSDLFIQLVSAQTGELFWSANGEILCDAEKRQIQAKVVPFDDDYGFVVWSDLRSSGKEDIKGLYAQKVDAYFQSLDEIAIVPSSQMKLHANYPNPFNPETNISFEINRNDYVSLKVYNLRGQLVRTLIDNEYLERGGYQTVWNGKDNSDRSVGSGVYFYQLESNNNRQVRKMLLLK